MKVASSGIVAGLPKVYWWSGDEVECFWDLIVFPMNNNSSIWWYCDINDNNKDSMLIKYKKYERWLFKK